MYKALISLSILILILIFSFACTNHDKTLLIWIGNQRCKHLSLHPKKKTYITVHGKIGVSILEISDGRVRMVASPCTDKICIELGWIERQGEALCCVSNQILITIDAKGPYDAISH